MTKIKKIFLMGVLLSTSLGSSVYADTIEFKGEDNELSLITRPNRKPLLDTTGVKTILMGHDDELKDRKKIDLHSIMDTDLMLISADEALDEKAGYSVSFSLADELENIDLLSCEDEEDSRSRIKFKPVSDNNIFIGFADKSISLPLKHQEITKTHSNKSALSCCEVSITSKSYPVEVPGGRNLDVEFINSRQSCKHSFDEDSENNSAKPFILIEPMKQDSFKSLSFVKQPELELADFELVSIKNKLYRLILAWKIDEYLFEITALMPDFKPGFTENYELLDAEQKITDKNGEIYYLSEPLDLKIQKTEDDLYEFIINTAGGNILDTNEIIVASYTNFGAPVSFITEPNIDKSDFCVNSDLICRQASISVKAFDSIETSLKPSEINGEINVERILIDDKAHAILDWTIDANVFNLFIKDIPDLDNELINDISYQVPTHQTVGEIILKSGDKYKLKADNLVLTIEKNAGAHKFVFDKFELKIVQDIYNADGEKIGFEEIGAISNNGALIILKY